MTRTRKSAAIASWVLGFLGGAWAMLTLLSSYMTTSGYIQTEDVVKALPLPLIAILIALSVHLWPGTVRIHSLWLWCVPVYLVAGGPLLMLVMIWLDQRYTK